MPTFVNSAYAPLTGTLLVAGIPSYGFGSLKTTTAPTRMTANRGQGNGTTASLIVQIVEGDIPVVGSLISTQIDKPAIQANNAVVTTVTIDSVTGAGSIVYNSAGTLSVQTLSGQAIVPQPEIPEVLANGASTAFCFQYNDPNTNNMRSVVATISLPTLPTTAKITLQRAINRIDSEFTDIVTIGTVTAGALSGTQAVATLEPGRWYRFNVSTLSGTGTIVAKLLV